MPTHPAWFVSTVVETQALLERYSANSQVSQLRHQMGLLSDEAIV